MANPLKRGLTSGQVSDQMPMASSITPRPLTSAIVPYGLQLRQTINAGTTSVTIPAGINWVFAICVGGGGAGTALGSGGGAGGITWGWTPSCASCVVGAGGSASIGGFTRYGHLFAGGGGYNLTAGGTGAGGGNGVGGNNGIAGTTNFYSQPGGAGGILSLGHY